ncbi:MAG: GxxExxY protein [Planctomycetes bacterium]|nr:GxxExxY protein [Planctomycetota bacterium]
MAEILFKDESYHIIGACFDVHNEMGSGFLESVYQECLAIEFRRRAIRYCSQCELVLRYKNETLESTYRPDFICYEQIIVELKAASALTDTHRAQVHNYLKATGYRLGLLVNFGGHPSLTYERIVR